VTGNKPEQTFRIGLVSASVFVNQIETGEGKRKETKDVRSVVFQRRYKDRDSGEWKSSDAYGLSDLPALKEVLALALAFVTAKEACGS
jgi:hypothetical protein